MVAVANDDSRLGMLEGRVTEQSVGIQDLRAGQREINGRIDQTNGRIDRLFLAIVGIGAAQIGLLITLITLIVRNL